MRSLFAILLSLLGFVFLFGAIGLGVYFGGFTPNGMNEQMGGALMVAGFVGVFSLLCGYGILDDLAKEKGKASGTLESADDEDDIDEEDGEQEMPCDSNTSCDSSHSAS